MIDIEIVVQYQVRDPAAYLVNVRYVPYREVGARHGLLTVNYGSATAALAADNANLTVLAPTNDAWAARRVAQALGLG